MRFSQQDMKGIAFLRRPLISTRFWAATGWLCSGVSTTRYFPFLMINNDLILSRSGRALRFLYAQLKNTVLCPEAATRPCSLLKRAEGPSEDCLPLSI